MPLNFVRLVTSGLFAALLVQSVWWCLIPDNAFMQPLNATLLIAAAICGIPADRVAAAADNRRQALRALHHDLERSGRLIAEARELAERPAPGQVYPRLVLGTLDTAVLMSALSPHRDREVLQRALDMRSIAQDLNRRLEMTELRLCTGDGIEQDELDLLSAIAANPDGPFARADSALTTLREAVEAALLPAQLLRRILFRD